MKPIILGVMGWQQLMLIAFVVFGVLGLIIYLIVAASRSKAKTEILNSVLEKQKNPNTLDELERLEKLKKSGSLTEAEFESEKKKIIGS